MKVKETESTAVRVEGKEKIAERRGELHIGWRARGYGTRRGVGPVRELCVRLLGAVPCAQQAAAERAVKLKFSVQLSIENMHFGDAFVGIETEKNCIRS